ncbi:MAG: hypothetical protein EBY32_04870 [Proteobacteria bacterium]|nr:hypothetical protein [Pseudomonadota bacterium]
MPNNPKPPNPQLNNSSKENHETIPQIQAATSLPAQTSISDRVNKVREAVGNSQSSILPGDANAVDSDIMWWRNAWGNGGWHNWHNGWRNGGGWRNWLNI